MAAIINSRIVRIASSLIAVCLISIPTQAKCENGVAASGETSTYVFVPDQSQLIQTGGIGGVHWTYSVKGYFQLTIDPNAGTASFTRVDANATDDSPFKRTLDPNHVFNMTSLVGTVEPSGSINFTGKAPDDSDVSITVTLQDGSAHLIGQTTPPPNSADFFIFSLDAVAQLRKYGGGSGTADNPYQIATAEDLMLLGDGPEDYDKHFILTADIDLDPKLAGRMIFDRAVIAPDDNDSKDYFKGTQFTGVFDGNDLTISNMIIEGGEYLGLFGWLGNGAKVKNLGVMGVNITGSGGSVGGLVGMNGYGSSITSCYSTGAVTGNNDVGGLVGYNRGSITASYSTGTVSGEEDAVGGLVGSQGRGWMDQLVDAIVANCYSTGTVSGNENVGGLVGGNGGWGGTSSITNSYSTGSVNGNENVGGLVGDNGGLGGINPGIITVSFWDIQTSGRTNMCGIHEGNTDCNDSYGKTTAEMQTASTFLDAGWDFVNVWGIGENQTYPYLRKYSAADINQDGSINFLDLAVLAENWLGGFD